MKIGILTQPLKTNYGGLLQAYALQTVLKRMGHEVLTINLFRKERPIQTIKKFLLIAKRLILHYISCKNEPIRTWLTTKEENLISRHTNRFIKENIRQTETIESKNIQYLINKYKFDAYIVGSDQVWRPKYSTCLSNYFLDFLDDNNHAKRIAYSASFGVDNWEFTEGQTKQCSSLVKKFNAVSVREHSAINLCKEKLGIEVTLQLDPTLLLEKEDYIKLIEKDNIPKSEGNLMIYILDKNKNNDEIIQVVSKELNLSSFSVMPKSKLNEVDKYSIKDCIYPPVTEWIRGFMDAEFIITDSFHGTVFSIIFNKPFISIGNQERGITRFSTLLKFVGLENRLILSLDELTTEMIYESIDYIKINDIIKKKKMSAFKFIDHALTN